MFKKQTLFVVGAGASFEVGLPLGKKLASMIKEKMDIRFELGNRLAGTGDTDLYIQLTRQFAKDPLELQQAAWLIRDGISLAQSIDDFLDLHRTNQHVNLYGKAAIVKTILEAERQSRLYFAGPDKEEYFDPEKCADTWLLKFLHMLGRGVPKENLQQIFDRVSFIVFNYDRCIEHFLHHALQKLYAIQEKEASDIVQTLRIVHPYGEVANVQFGASRSDYATLAGRIRTYTEQMTDTKMTEKLQNEMHRAESIVFLGFAYHDQNMALVQPVDPMSAKHIYGTAYGMSDSDVEITSHQIRTWYADENDSRIEKMIHIDNKLKCADLFDYYARTLTAGD